MDKKLWQREHEHRAGIHVTSIHDVDEARPAHAEMTPFLRKVDQCMLSGYRVQGQPASWHAIGSYSRACPRARGITRARAHRFKKIRIWKRFIHLFKWLGKHSSKCPNHLDMVANLSNNYLKKHVNIWTIVERFGPEAKAPA